jgi:hypothetical protein
MPSQNFWQIVDTYSTVATKVHLAIAFYQRLHGTFDESYFRGIAKDSRGLS